MNAVPALESTHQSLSACPVISGPLSHRRCAGAPRSAASASSTITALSASMPRSTSILQRLTRELVYHVEQLDHLAVGGLVELKIECPHLIRALRPQPLRRHRRLPKPPALALAQRYPQPFLTPDPLHALAVDLPALLAQPMMRATVPPPRTVRRELAQLSAQRRVIPGTHRLSALRRPMLAHHPTCPALADAETVAQHRDRPAPTGWAYQFPRDISFNARFSNA